MAIFQLVHPVRSLFMNCELAIRDIHTPNQVFQSWNNWWKTAWRDSLFFPLASAALLSRVLQWARVPASSLRSQKHNRGRATKSQVKTLCFSVSLRLINSRTDGLTVVLVWLVQGSKRVKSGPNGDHHHHDQRPRSSLPNVFYGLQKLVAESFKSFSQIFGKSY